MGSPYDLSAGGGLRALALLERAHIKRLSARHLRATAGMYSNEHDWVQKARASARDAEREAEHLEYMARGE